jgi:hypothetical protein
MNVMIKKAIWILLAVSVLAFVLGSTVRADERNKQSVPLADASKALVPAIAIDVTSFSLTDLETVPMVAVPPAEDRDPAIAAVIQTRSLPNVAARVPAPATPGVMRRPVQ